MEKNKYIVNGQELTEEEFQKLVQDKNVKMQLIEGTSNQYRMLIKLMEG